MSLKQLLDNSITPISNKVVFSNVDPHTQIIAMNGFHNITGNIDRQDYKRRYDMVSNPIDSSYLSTEPCQRCYTSCYTKSIIKCSYCFPQIKLCLNCYAFSHMNEHMRQKKLEMNSLRELITEQDNELDFLKTENLLKTYLCNDVIGIVLGYL